MSDKVRYTVEERIGTIVIDNPPVNALAQEVLKAFSSILDTAEGDDSKVLIITGSGMFFSAGADIKEIQAFDSSETALEKLKTGQAILNRVEDFKKPVIAAINGICLGGGMELAMACHFRYASDMIKMGQPEITLGIIPGFGGTQRLPRLVGRSKAAELILTGDQITGKEAHAIGLVNKVTPPETLMKHVKSFAKKLASMGSEAMAEALSLTLNAGDVPIKEGLEREAKEFAKLVGSDDMKEGMKAFLEKRKPRFK
jgi:enoyl-CoA hydratase/carnithine racemase